MLDDELESRILWFEEAWQLQGSPSIVRALDETTPALRARLLLELVAIDLEFRWRSAGPVARFTLEDYIAQVPELASLDALPLELIGEEYRVRSLWGDRPSHAEFVSRFRTRQEAILAEVAGVDIELEQESVTPRALRNALGPGEADIDPGQPLLSHQEFHLLRLIGAGRMGKVYEASQSGSDREVAVKFLRKSFLNHPGVVRRFIGEARTIAGLRHPNIVGTQGLGRTPAGAYFIVMDLVRGTDLARLGRRRAIAPAEAARWLLAACDALEHAHERGIVHCDLKPANLLIDEDGRIRVTDFGLARSLAEETPWAAELEGTASFMAPEQAARGLGPIDRRTDVYGLGAVLYALLTGRPPFLGRTLPDVLALVASGTPVVAPGRLREDLPEPLGDVCVRCLAKDPRERFATVAELRTALARVSDGSGGSEVIEVAGPVILEES